VESHIHLWISVLGDTMLKDIRVKKAPEASREHVSYLNFLDWRRRPW